ncbi:MAG: hypothetical protein NTV23_12160 [Propionibacteriales bacterium]|nr:hypothetical protein [Propionibacteriales bacterium]
MPRSITSALTVVGAVCVLVLAANTVAMAATGKSFLLGKINSANQQTSLVRTTVGPALRLTTKSTANAPLTTNARGKVANLNADRVDGLEGSSLQTRPIVITAGGGGSAFSIAVPLDLPVGTYLVSYSARPSTATAFEFSCWVSGVDQAVGREGGLMGGTVFEAPPALSGAGLFTSFAEDKGSLVCWSNKGFTVNPGAIQVVATRVDGVTKRPTITLP